MVSYILTTDHCSYMNSDIGIARAIELLPIQEIARRLHIPPKYIIPYGPYIAKVHSDYLQDLQGRKDGRLVLVTSMSPTPQGEGKTTLTIGLAQALNLLGRRAIACIRQPSLGPFFGVKGGATGGGYSQVLPMEDITLHFTGDDHAVTTSHNLISSIIDNHLYHGNKLGIDPNRILWRRVSNINDRALRMVRVGLVKGGVERLEEFHISSASEIMSILCLSQNLQDLKRRVEGMIVAFDDRGNAVTPGDLNIHGAVAALLKDALHPNLVQSLEGTPVFVHGGPFGNVSLGCSSLMATRLALKLSEYVLTEAGFATDLGAEKFFDIKCRVDGLRPSAVVIVATLRALHLHGGINDGEGGMENLLKHIENIQGFDLPVVVAINHFPNDTDKEIREVIRTLGGKGVLAFMANVREEGGKGGMDLAEGLVELCKRENGFHYLYPLEMPVEEKITTIARSIYGADGVVFTEGAKRDIKDIEALRLSNLPVCIAKTPKSLSDNPTLLGRPKGFNITIHRVLPASGAGFLVAHCSSILLMPGLPEHPMAERIDVDKDGRVIQIPM